MPLNLRLNIEDAQVISNEELHTRQLWRMAGSFVGGQKKAAAADTPLYTCRSLSPDGRISLTSGRLSYVLVPDSNRLRNFQRDIPQSTCQEKLFEICTNLTVIRMRN